MSKFISVWCEYDFGGNFGGSNNEDVFAVEDHLTTSEIENLVYNLLMKSIRCITEEDLEDMYGWSFLEVKDLKAVVNE